MHLKRFFAVFLSSAFISVPAQLGTNYAFAADETEKHTVTFVDFDGKLIQKLTVAPDEVIDYTKISTSALHKHIDKYTEQDFSAWSETPSTTDSDITIQALSKTATLSIDGLPKRTKYFKRSGKIDLSGLKINITIKTQTPVKDSFGNYVVDTVVTDISKSCSIDPLNLNEAFAYSDSAKVNIFPITSQNPIYTYEIKCYDYLGDVNENGLIDGTDATAVLSAYAKNAASKSFNTTSEFNKRGDVNMDGLVDARDASYILKYYSLASVNGFANWEDIVQF